MRQRAWAGITLAAVLTAGAAAQQAPRVPISRLPPTYPELARRMKVFGTVKVLVTVSRAGTVSAAQAVDGHPLLRQEAERCVRLWRFMPGPKESTFVVPVEFELD